MNPLDVLRKIIANHGKCDGMKPDNCRECPFSSMTKDDAQVGCIEGIGIEGLPESEADNKYLEAAQSKLLDLEIEETLKDKDVAE